jgi:glycerol-3-phosphate cytidylyltransferase-like family protein
MKPREKIIVICGEFDGITYEEVKILKACKSKGDWLIVGLYSDDYMNMHKVIIKNSFEQRKEIMESLSVVDEVFSFHDVDGTACNLLKLVKLCYPMSDIVYVSDRDRDMGDIPEYKIRGITFAVIK